MFASKTSHKRRRSSARGDASRAAASSSRAIVTVAGMGGGEEAEEGEPSWAWKRLERVVESHAINHCLQVLVPLPSPDGAAGLMNCLPSPPKAYLAQVPLCLFLDPIFITSHIKQGKLVALSKGNLDTEDVFCLDGNGLLHLSLTRDSYQSLGLVGQALKQSRTSSGKGRDRRSGKTERWTVRIHLLAPSFYPGKPGYDRTLARLGEWDQRRRGGNGACWETLLCWTDGQASQEMYFPSRHVRQDSIQEINTVVNVSTLDDCWVPEHTGQWNRGWAAKDGQNCAPDWETWRDALDAFLEWAALASLSADCVRTFSRSDHFNSYEAKQAGAGNAAAVLKLQYHGLLPSEYCAQVMQAVRAHVSQNDLDFALLSCSGFTDSPLAWRMEPTLTASELQWQVESSQDESGEDTASDQGQQLETGPRARKRRQKKRNQRGTINRDQVGHQVKLPGASSCNGWQVLLPGGRGDRAEYISIENVTGCSRC